MTAVARRPSVPGIHPIQGDELRALRRPATGRAVMVDEAG